MGYVPSEYDKYFNFGLIDYSEFDINIEPPTPPPIPPNNNINNNQESQGQDDQVSMPDNSESNQESIDNPVKDQEIMPEQTQNECLAVETDSDMNYCFDIVSYSLYPECTNIEEVTSCPDTTVQSEQSEEMESTKIESIEENLEEQGSDFDIVPMEVRKPCKMIFNQLFK